jgi:hypothetical protein
MLLLGNATEVLGSLYVIEDSALGGRQVAPLLKRTLGLAQGRGASYLHGFGGETGAMWNNFRVLASLEIGESSRDTARACQSARRTFAALLDLFAPLAPPAPAAAMDENGARQTAPDRLPAHGARDPASFPPATEDDMHIDLEVDDVELEGDTVLELPLEDLDDLDDGGGDTLPMPL